MIFEKKQDGVAIQEKATPVNIISYKKWKSI